MCKQEKGAPIGERLCFECGVFGFVSGWLEYLGETSRAEQLDDSFQVVGHYGDADLGSCTLQASRSIFGRAIANSSELNGWRHITRIESLRTNVALSLKQFANCSGCSGLPTLHQWARTVQTGGPHAEPTETAVIAITATACSSR
jgi:hypothetical protein